MVLHDPVELRRLYPNRRKTLGIQEPPLWWQQADLTSDGREQEPKQEVKEADVSLLDFDRAVIRVNEEEDLSSSADTENLQPADEHLQPDLEADLEATLVSFSQACDEVSREQTQPLEPAQPPVAQSDEGKETETAAFQRKAKAAIFQTKVEEGIAATKSSSETAARSRQEAFQQKVG